MTTLIQGDCLEVADQIADGSIDFVLTDPPYNISNDGAKPVWIDPETGENKNTIHSQKFSENFEQDWDAVTHDQFLLQLEQWSKLWHNKLRKGGSFAVFISDQYISYLWKTMADVGLEPKRVWTWKKPAAVPFNRGVNPVSGCEYIVWGIKPGGKRTFNSDTDLLSTNQKSKTFKTGREREKERERDSSSPFQVFFSVPALLLCNDDVFPLPVLVRRARRALLRRARVHAPELGRRLLQR